jgi:CRP-like cAMP-binding protein
MVLSIQHSPNSHKQEISDPTNQLLNSLPESELTNLRVHSESLIIPAKKSLYKLDEPIDRVYFPLRGIISLVNISEDGLIAETAAISNEGMVGIAGFLGGNFVSSLAITTTDCVAISLPIDILRREFARGGELQRILLLYTQALLTQVSQNVFCSCHHTLEQRLARWLLFYRDCLETNKILLTQETLADLLGVRRSSLSVVAAELRQRNIINYNRGKITIVNYVALRMVACRCDRIILEEYTRLFS